MRSIIKFTRLLFQIILFLELRITFIFMARFKSSKMVNNIYYFYTTCSFESFLQQTYLEKVQSVKSLLDRKSKIV